MKVKICGLKTYDEALQAVEVGADLLGFNFYPKSPRFITPGDCARLVAKLRDALLGAPVTLVGVFVNAPAEEIEQTLRDGGLDLAQLSGDEPPEDLARLGQNAFKALRPSSPEDLDRLLERYPRRQSPPAILIDAYRPGEYGGTGLTADWSLAGRAAQRYPLLLAGGLTPENAAAAVRQVRPWGVDVASGVESAPGRKDPQKVTALIRAAKQVEEEAAP